MKRLYYCIAMAFLAVSSLTIASCGDDDKENVNDKNLLVGVWVSEGTVPMYGNSERTEVIGSVKLYLRFMEDGSFIEKDVITNTNSGKTYTETSTYGRWTATGDMLRITESFEDIGDPQDFLDSYEYSYQFKNGKLILTNNKDTGEVLTVTFVRGEMPIN